MKVEGGANAFMRSSSRHQQKAGLAVRIFARGRCSVPIELEASGSSVALRAIMGVNGLVRSTGVVISCAVPAVRGGTTCS